jgi:hypothetical protein
MLYPEWLSLRGQERDLYVDPSAKRILSMEPDNQAIGNGSSSLV